MAKKVVLVIMDGWGIAPVKPYNAITNAHTPSYDRLIREYPNTSLNSSGLSVGLPEGQVGTSEVNHLTIGTGRVIFQDLPKINLSIQTGEFFTNQALLNIISHTRESNTNLHLIGIISDGGVHSHINHIFAILDLLAKEEFKQKVYFHLFTDGRDVPPKSAQKYLNQLNEKILEVGIGEIATLQGRYLLDRDRDWAKTDQALSLIAKGDGNRLINWQAALNQGYNQVETDEYLPQYIFSSDSQLKNQDGVFFFHFRSDRMYQLTKRILDLNLKIKLGAFIEASEEFKGMEVAFPRIKLDHTLAETISKAGLRQIHITETEKFPHLTYFLNGEREHEFPLEKWKMFESNRYVKPRYNLEPSMRNYEITKELIKTIEQDESDFYVVNISSADMVGHTGNYNAAVVSAEAVDYCIGKIAEAVLKKSDQYALLITADHGNSEIMWDELNNQPHTQHTLSKVPFILISNEKYKLGRNESLADIAPTILTLLGLTIPKTMTGKSMIS